MKKPALMMVQSDDESKKIAEVSDDSGLVLTR